MKRLNPVVGLLAGVNLGLAFGLLAPVWVGGLILLIAIALAVIAGISIAREVWG